MKKIFFAKNYMNALWHTGRTIKRTNKKTYRHKYGTAHYKNIGMRFYFIGDIWISKMFVNNSSFNVLTKPIIVYSSWSLLSGRRLDYGSSARHRPCTFGSSSSFNHALLPICDGTLGVDLSMNDETNSCVILWMFII